MPPNKNHPATPKSLPRPKSFHTNPGLFVFTWALTLILLPFVIALLSLLFVYRTVIRQIARAHGNLVDPLTPYDCIFAVDSYTTRPYASNLTVLELGSRLDLNTLRSLFKTRILDNPTFSKLYCAPVEYLGYWFWKKLDNIPDVNTCVNVYYDSELEQSGKEKNVDECLREIVEMPYDNQLFNVFLMHFGNKSCIVFRIHHTVCDGYSFNKLIDTFVGLQSKYLVKNTVKGDWAMSFKRAVKEWSKYASLIFHLPLHISQLYRESLTHTPNFYTLPKTSKTGMIRRTILPLSQMKHIRQTSNSHFASTGMALMTGALQKYFDATPHPPHLRPDRLSIMHSLPRQNHPLNCTTSDAKREMCNWWGVGLFKIPFMRDSVARLYGAEDDFNEYMRLQYHNVLHIHIPIVSLIPCWVVKWFFTINFGTSCGFTSVPGLFDKIAYVGGSPETLDTVDGGALEHSTMPVEVTHMWKVFGLQWRQSAVAVAMYTYRGEASVSLYANKGDIIENERGMDRLLGFLHQEFNELVEHANNSSKQPLTQSLLPASQQPQLSAADLFDSVKTPLLIDAWPRNNKLA